MLKIERGQREEYRKWENGVGLRIRGRDTITVCVHKKTSFSISLLIEPF